MFSLDLYCSVLICIVQFYCSPQIILYFSWESLLSNTPNRYFPAILKIINQNTPFLLFKLAWSIDSLAKKVVGEKQTVALVVQFVVTILNMITEIDMHSIIDN